MTKKTGHVIFYRDTLCYLFLSFEWLVPIATVLYFVSGVTIAIVLLLLAQSHLKFPKLGAALKTTNSYKLIGLGMMAVVMCHLGYCYMDDAPLDYHDSDMLPIIKVMSQRFCKTTQNMFMIRFQKSGMAYNLFICRLCGYRLRLLKSCILIFDGLQF